MSNIILVHTQTVFQIVLLHRKNRTIYTVTLYHLNQSVNKLKQKPKNTCFNKRRKRQKLVTEVGSRAAGTTSL